MLLESIFRGLINFLSPIIFAIVTIIMILIGVGLSILIVVLPLYIIYLILKKIGIVTQFNSYKMKKKGLLVTFTYDTVRLLLHKPGYIWDFKNCIVTTKEGTKPEISNKFYMSLKDKRRIKKVLNDIACQEENTKSLNYKKELLIQNLALVKKLEKDIKKDSERIDYDLSVSYQKYTDQLNNLTLNY